MFLEENEIIIQEEMNYKYVYLFIVPSPSFASVFIVHIPATSLQAIPLFWFAMQLYTILASCVLMCITPGCGLSPED